MSFRPVRTPRETVEGRVKGGPIIGQPGRLVTNCNDWPVNNGVARFISLVQTGETITGVLRRLICTGLLHA